LEIAAPGGGSVIIIVSGTRHAAVSEYPEIETRLGQWRRHGNVTLVHGDATGVDRIAANIAAGWGWIAVAMPADWQTCNDGIARDLGGCPPSPHLATRHGRTYCPYAGHRRNQLMLDRHPDADLAVCFPAADGGTKSGTGDFIDRAIRAGLPHQTFPLRVQRPDMRPLLPAGERP
jgi:hypothetical protein